jgi:glycine dehydrogenase
MMIEPTESEAKEEIDRFCEAMIKIHSEIDAIRSGKMPKSNNLLKNAPHTFEDLISDAWDRPYSRSEAATPLKWIGEDKFWPFVGRVDNAYGDRNLICSCKDISEYES